MDWLTHTFTLSVAISFVVGVAGGLSINWLVSRRSEGTVRSSRFQVMVGVSIVVAMLFIMVATEQAHECAVKLSAAVTVEQTLAAQERKALQDLFLAAMNPPADIVALPQEDPARRAWGAGIGKAYIDTVTRTSQARAANQVAEDSARRACGK